ncbi:hypothetical protein [Aliikangiella sp. G2MR2-5]|uniref:hypothetical protein n=1 Tax=Aliikangiella sp. G2MR2-5 TaxID=2788943 RepID=UPI0018ABB54D|nr:hypothetical protein [Aliikangiella sp. G2MR2-5]
MKQVVYLITLVAVLTLSGCKKTIPVRDFNSMPISGAHSEKSTVKSVETAILQACLSLGWKTRVVKQGEIEATLNIRKHQLVVSITHDNKEYSIKYKDSVNLLYDGKKIHRQYGNWTRNLMNSISAFSLSN